MSNISIGGIKLTFDDTTIELTVEEAKDLQRQLNQLFSYNPYYFNYNYLINHAYRSTEQPSRYKVEYYQTPSILSSEKGI